MTPDTALKGITALFFLEGGFVFFFGFDFLFFFYVAQTLEELTDILQYMHKYVCMEKQNCSQAHTLRLID